MASTWLAVLVAVAALPAGGILAEQPLGKRLFAPGSRLAGSGDGRRVTVERGSWQLSLWSAEGELLARSPLPVSRDAVLSSLAVRPPHALVGVVDPASPGLTALLVELSSGALHQRFEVPIFPASLFAAADGWLVQEMSFSDPPRLYELSAAGTLRRELAIPVSVWERARTLGKPVAAALTVTVAGGAAWAVPAGWYELWELRGSTPRVVAPPPCLAVSGHLLSGEAAGGKMAWRYGEEGREMARGAAKRRAAPGGGGAGATATPSLARRSSSRPRGSFFPAALGVAGEGSQLVVLLDVVPEQPEGGCRLDLWDLTRPALTAVAPLPGPCPVRVALAGRKVWLYEASNRVSLVAEAFHAPPPCPLSPPPPIAH